MSGVNKVILIGNLGKDPEVRNLEGGNKVVRFSLATSETHKDKTTGQRVDQTEWHNIVLWTHLAELAETYLKKGSQIYLEGKIKNRTWDDKEGKKHYITEIWGDSMTFLGKPADKQQNGSSEPAVSLAQEPSPDDQDLPF
jgi:single-strand DNA-binding protein